MDPSRFTSGRTGELRQIAQPKKDWAFIPAELPTDWDFDPSLWPLLVEAKEALGTLNGIGQTLPNPDLLLRPLQSREAITSSKIEGTHVTPEQLLLYQLDPREPKQADDKASDWFEVFNYSAALNHGRSLLQDLPICNRVIREMHAILMRGVRGRNKNPGEFRKWQVQIGSSGRFLPPPPQEIDRLMTNLEKCVNSAESRYDPLVRSYLIHYQFEAVHPFGDGNGRVGRSLLALMIYKWLGHSMPWLYMSAFFERYKDEYIDKLFKVSTEGAWTPWIEYCLRGTIDQANDSVRRCHSFNRLRLEFPNRLNSHSPRTCQIIEGLFTTPLVTVGTIAEKYDITYPTARSDIDRLIEARILVESADSYPKSFLSAEIMKVAYGDFEAEVAPAE